MSISSAGTSLSDAAGRGVGLVVEYDDTFADLTSIMKEELLYKPPSTSSPSERMDEEY